MGEKWGQEKQVSAGNERKEGREKKARGYRQKNKGKFQTDVPKAAVWLLRSGWGTMQSLPDICISLVQTQKQIKVDCKLS